MHPNHLKNLSPRELEALQARIRECDSSQTTPTSPVILPLITNDIASAIITKKTTIPKKKQRAITIGPPEEVEPPEEVLDHRFGHGPLPDRVAEDIIGLGRKGPKVPVGQAAPVFDLLEEPSSEDEGGTKNPISVADDSGTESPAITKEAQMAIAVVQDEHEGIAAPHDHYSAPNEGETQEGHFEEHVEEQLSQVVEQTQMEDEDEEEEQTGIHSSHPDFVPFVNPNRLESLDENQQSTNTR